MGMEWVWNGCEMGVEWVWNGWEEDDELEDDELVSRLHAQLWTGVGRGVG